MSYDNFVSLEHGIWPILCRVTPTHATHACFYARMICRVSAWSRGEDDIADIWQRGVAREIS